MISANGGLPAHRYTPQVTQRWPRGSEPASVSPPLAGLKTTLFSQCGPLMPLQVRYLALNLHPITCPSRGTMCRTSSMFYGLSLKVLSDRPAWTSSGGPAKRLYGPRRMMKR